MEQKSRKRIAVVGSGMAGLVTAYLLHHDPHGRYDVTLFEESKELSFDLASISLPNQTTGGVDRIDLPMRAFAGGYYKRLKALYDHLGVHYQSQPFLFSFSNLDSHDSRPYFIHSSNNHRIPPFKPPGRTWLSYMVENLYLLVWYTYFTFCCIFVRPRSTGYRSSCEPLDEYLDRIHLPPYFITHYLLPLISSVTTCPHTDLLRFPACDVIDYKRRTNGALHYKVADGVGDAQSRLAKEINTNLNTHVLSVIQASEKVVLEWRHTDDAHGLALFTEKYDSVILGVSPDIVGRIFKPLQSAMAQIPTIRVESTVHTDDSAIQDQLLLNTGQSQSIHLRTSTYEARTESVHVQPSGVLVTTCPIIPIDADQIIQTSAFTRVLRTPESRSIVNAIFDEAESKEDSRDEKPSGWRNGDGHVWLVGGWCWDGLVLLEGCVVSALRTAKAFGVDPSWARPE